MNTKLIASLLLSNIRSLEKHQLQESQSYLVNYKPKDYNMICWNIMRWDADYNLFEDDQEYSVEFIDIIGVYSLPTEITVV